MGVKSLVEEIKKSGRNTFFITAHPTFCTSRRHAHLAAGKGSGEKVGSANSVIAEAINIFSDDGNADKAVMAKTTLNDAIKSRVGCTPPKIGRPNLAPDKVMTGILDYFRMLAVHKVPCYYCTRR